ncbi:hypothetical protein AC094_42700 [Bacteroides fragilis]|uniref:Uncharacterized protein n=1 Tax=Bacteroides fragilis TaxID=817 RepID=A0A853PPF3_BACFG|nr:hypothetical protein M075_4396 [Bacteroides fragilis str. 20793-3]OCR27498.1 hypothetical protein AC094_42700 [Bacteroides fragilis]
MHKKEELLLNPQKSINIYFSTMILYEFASLLHFTHSIDTEL